MNADWLILVSLAAESWNKANEPAAFPRQYGLKEFPVRGIDPKLRTFVG